MPGMPYRALGSSGIRVSRISLGTMMLGGVSDAAESQRIIDHAASAGVNFIDTADVYADGRSETVVGAAIRAQRARWVLATKVGQRLAPDADDFGLSRRYVLRAVDASLQRLGTDYIDLYYIHRVDPDTAWEQVVATFGELIRAGKIREWGLSNVRAWHIAHIVHLCRQMGVPEPAALQPYYNLMNRQPEVELLPAARQFGLGVVPYSPIARGVLSGKYRANQTAEAGSRAARQDKRMMETEWRPESLMIAETLKAHAESRGTTLVHWATAWVLHNAVVTSVIAGPRTLAQWESYLGAVDYQWTDEDEALANRLVPTGHASTHGYNDPAYPIEGRFRV